MPDHDVVVIGGGFYGCCIALHMRQELGLSRVLVVERETTLLSRASHGNQARVHHGYHYPRDFTTAYRSRVNFPRFVERFKPAIDDGFLKLYAIARRSSHVSARQFLTAMHQAGAPVREASRRHAALFSPAMVEAVFEVREFAFNSSILSRMLTDEMERAGVQVILGAEASVLSRTPGEVTVRLDSGQETRDVTARSVFCCTYGRTGHVPGAPTMASVKFEVAEICLVEPPPELQSVGVTVMDGPFFSCMPFPSRGLHSLTHVRYTPHVAWKGNEHPGRDPYAFAAAFPGHSQFGHMVRDSARFLPCLERARHRDSIFEVKAVLVADEQNDGRPILVEGEATPGSVVTVLGGKLDNIYDVLDAIDAGQGMGARA